MYIIYILYDHICTMNQYNNRGVDTSSICRRKSLLLIPPTTSTRRRASPIYCRSRTSNKLMMLTIIASVSILLVVGLRIPLPQQPLFMVEAFMIIEHHPNPTCRQHVKSTPDRQRYGGVPPFLLTSPRQQHVSVKLNSNVATKPQSTEIISDDSGNDDDIPQDTSSASSPSSTTIITSEEVKLRMEKQLERLKLKDRMSPKLSKEVCICKFTYIRLVVVFLCD